MGLFHWMIVGGASRQEHGVGCWLFSPHCPEYFVEGRKRSLSFSCAGRLAVTRVSDASFSSCHDVAHPAVQVVCSTQNRVTRRSVWRPFLARDSEWNRTYQILEFPEWQILKFPERQILEFPERQILKYASRS